MNNITSSIVGTLLEHLMNERMDSILSGNPEHIKFMENIDKAEEHVKRLNLSMGQRMAVDTLISAYTAYGAYYAKMAYQQGMKDCAALMREVGVL